MPDGGAAVIGVVAAVSADPTHSFSKRTRSSVRLLAGLGVEGDARDADGGLVRKAGVMAVVVVGGAVRAGDLVTVEPPPEPHRPLAPV